MRFTGRSSHPWFLKARKPYGFASGPHALPAPRNIALLLNDSFWEVVHAVSKGNHLLLGAKFLSAVWSNITHQLQFKSTANRPKRGRSGRSRRRHRCRCCCWHGGTGGGQQVPSQPQGLRHRRTRRPNLARRRKQQSLRSHGRTSECEGGRRDPSPRIEVKGPKRQCRRPGLRGREDEQGLRPVQGSPRASGRNGSPFGGPLDRPRSPAC